MVKTRKRKHKRYTKNCETNIVSRNITFKASSTDFSLNGLFLKTNHPLAPDTVIDITVHLPDNTVSKLKGKVRWSFKSPGKSSPYTDIPMVSGRPIKSGMGIEIIERDVNYLHFIRSLLA